MCLDSEQAGTHEGEVPRHVEEGLAWHLEIEL